MSDLSAFQSAINKTNTPFEIIVFKSGIWRLRAIVDGGKVDDHGEYGEQVEFCEWDPSSTARIVLRVSPGDRCHFEAEFDNAGDLISIGQFEDM